MGTPIISIQNAAIQQNKNVVLDKVSLKIDAGAFVYFIGRTGSGKSSLIRTLYAALPLKSVKLASVTRHWQNLRVGMFTN